MGIDKSCVTQYNLFVMINTLQQKENNMKNRIVLLLVVTLLLLLSACNEGASDNASESIESQGLSRGESREETSEPTEVHQYFDWKDCSLFGMSDGTLKAHIKEWDKEYVVPSSFVAASDDKVNQNFDATFAETVVLLSKGEIDSKKVRVEFSLEDMDMSGFQQGATYEQIKAYVLEHTGLKVSSLYISQVKRKCGLDVGQNYNLLKKEGAKVPQCPPKKEAAIVEALKHFQMI